MSDSTSSPRAVKSIPHSELEQLLITQYATEIIKQNDRLDDLAKQLFTLQLAIPSLYVTALQLLSGKNSLPNDTTLLAIAAFCWACALVCTVVALFPLLYKVPSHVVRMKNKTDTSFLSLIKSRLTNRAIKCDSIEGFYHQCATDKRRALFLSGLCFFLSIGFAGASIIGGK